jgi:hypothetical protein
LGKWAKKRGAEQLASTEADCSAPLKDSGTMDLQACRPLLTTRVTTLYWPAYNIYWATNRLLFEEKREFRDNYLFQLVFL